MWNWCDITDRADIKADRLKRTQSRFATRPWATDLHINVFHTMFNGFITGIFGSHLRREWGRFP
jgi:hypothetical protein